MLDRVFARQEHGPDLVQYCILAALLSSNDYCTNTIFGVAYYMTLWYRPSEVSSRLGITYLAGPVSGLYTVG